MLRLLGQRPARDGIVRDRQGEDPLQGREAVTGGAQRQRSL